MKYLQRRWNLPNTREDLVLGVLGLERELLRAGSHRLEEALSGFLLELTDTERGDQPAGGTLLRTGEDQTLGILLPFETVEIRRRLGVRYILDKLLAGSAEERAEMF